MLLDKLEKLVEEETAVKPVSPSTGVNRAKPNKIN
jgi:hypothetical protein